MKKEKIKKKPHSAEFKHRVALAAIKGNQTIPELCQQFGVVSSQVYKWKNALIESGFIVFKDGAIPNESKEIEKLHAAIGRLKVENDFLSKVLGNYS